MVETKKRILIIEDDGVPLKQIMNALSDNFGKVIEIDRASSLTRAFKKIREFKPHLIISDMDLGEGERNAAVVVQREIKKRKYHIKLIICSSGLDPKIGVPCVDKDIAGEFCKDLVFEITKTFNEGENNG